MKSLSRISLIALLFCTSFFTAAQAIKNQFLFNFGIAADAERVGLGLTSEYRYSPYGNSHAFGIQNDIRLLSAVFTTDIPEDDQGVYCTWLATYTYTIGKPGGRLSLDITGGAGLGFQRVNRPEMTYQLSGQVSANIRLIDGVYLNISPLVLIPNKLVYYTNYKEMGLSVPIGLKAYF